MKKLYQTLSVIALAVSAITAPVSAQAASDLVDGPWTFSLLDESWSAPYFYHWSTTTTFTQTFNSGDTYDISGSFNWYYGPTGSIGDFQGTESFGAGSFFDNATGMLHIVGLSLSNDVGIKTLSTRTYDLQLTLGSPNDTLNGGWTCGNSCSGLVSATAPAAAVPEPETYAMMLAGLGVIGFLGKRRKLG